jgi:hypothetical protein
MNRVLQTRQRMFALALPLTAALYITAEGLDPKGSDQIVTTTAVAFKVLPIAAKHHTQLYLSGSLSAAGIRNLTAHRTVADSICAGLCHLLQSHRAPSQLGRRPPLTGSLAATVPIARRHIQVGHARECR